MKTLFLLLFLVPMSLLAQTDTTLLPPLATFRADTLKPIEIREYPYTYTTHSTSTTNGHRYTSSTTHTGLGRIYSYDGIDVDRPVSTLSPVILALNNPDANQELTIMAEINDRRATNVGIGLTLSIGGLVMMFVGAAQAADYQKALNAQRQSYYAQPSYSTVTSTKPVYVSCSAWYGSLDPKTGITNYTCATDPRITSTNPGAGSYPVPGSAVTSTNTVYTPHTTPPTSVDKPDGKGLIIAGTIGLTLGLVVAVLGNDGIDHFHRAVQYYNRALSRNISWRLEPYSTYGGSGLTLRGRF